MRLLFSLVFCLGAIYSQLSMAESDGYFISLNAIIKHMESDNFDGADVLKVAVEDRNILESEIGEQEAKLAAEVLALIRSYKKKGKGKDIKNKEILAYFASKNKEEQSDNFNYRSAGAASYIGGMAVIITCVFPISLPATLVIAGSALIAGGVFYAEEYKDFQKAQRKPQIQKVKSSMLHYLYKLDRTNN